MSNEQLVLYFIAALKPLNLAELQLQAQTKHIFQNISLTLP